MKAPARHFRLSDWYGEDWDHKKPVDDFWVSPWAKAHYKLRQQEIEIEQCMFMMQHAVENEDFEEADGLKTRVERLRSQHPIIPREERLADALEDGNFALAEIFQKDLEAIKTNLGLPKYNVGQAVVHQHRDGLRGVVIDVDLQCSQGRNWVHAAGCLERVRRPANLEPGLVASLRLRRPGLLFLSAQGCAVDMPAEEMEVSQLKAWVNQPFYVVILDLEDMQDEEVKPGEWKWRWPAELAAWDVNSFEKLPAPVYLSEEALAHDPDDETTPAHPELKQLFEGHDTSPHRGRVYRAKPRLRLWQQKRAKEQQEVRRKRRVFSKASKNPYDVMKS